MARVVILSCDVCGKPGERVIVSSGTRKWTADLCDGCLGELVSGWGLAEVQARCTFTVYADEKEAKQALDGP